MVLEKLPCTEQDFPRIFELISVCFAHEHPYINCVFPAHSTPTGRAAGAERFLSFKRADPNTSFWKIVDSDITSDGKGSEIIAIAKWNVYNNTIPEEGGIAGDYWKEDVDGLGGTEQDRIAYADALFRGYLVPRRKAIRETGGNLVSLDILVTDPKHQYRGAGGMLVQHGCDIADDLGVDTVVEASTYGKHLYEQKGFKNLGLVTLHDVPELWKNEQKQEFFWMRRPKTG